MSRRRYPGWALCLTAAIASLSIVSCTGMGSQRDTERTMKESFQRMLEDIYASQRPVRFEQLDVADIVLKHMPLGTDKATIRASFASSSTGKIIEDSPGKLLVRENKGRAMLDLDARSVVITFWFDTNDTLTKVDARHMKHQ
jgi:Family of unknown function (DUF6393)